MGEQNNQGLTFAVSAEETGRITEYVEAALEEKDVSMGTVIKMNIAVDEIFSNIVKFSGATYAKITCGTEEGSAYLIFEDDGIAYNPLEHTEPDITLSAEEREIGGLGILMVKKSMDSVVYERADNKNILTLRKKG